MSAEIISAMLGTAGHVDHGKTSLVQNLTGINTDRHPEEQKRGMSIDFAVAPLTLDNQKIVGIIDVPGHEDFIRNMVSGASAIDILLLIIAADDAVMPQTVEHLRIAKALGMSQVIAVITKIDLVSNELLAIVKTEIDEFLTQAGFNKAPILQISNLTKQGIPELKATIQAAINNFIPEQDFREFRNDQNS